MKIRKRWYALGLVTATFISGCLVDSGSTTYNTSQVSALRRWEKHFVGPWVSGGKQYDCYALVMRLDLSSKGNRSLTSAFMGARQATSGVISCGSPKYPKSTQTCQEYRFEPKYSHPIYGTFIIGSFPFKICNEERVSVEFPRSGESATVRLRWDPTGKPGVVRAGDGRKLVFTIFGAVPKGTPAPKWSVKDGTQIRHAECGFFGCSPGKIETF